MIIVMVVNLYAVRILLNALGVEGYGIYNIIAGVITMLYSLSGVLSAATQRYFSYSIGLNDPVAMRKVFSTSLVLHVLLAIGVLLLGETVGLWFINSQLDLPNERMTSVNWLYQFTIFSFVALVIQIPYSAALIAHEEMNVYAFISIAESVLKVLAAVLLDFISIDGLIVYGASLFSISLFVLTSFIVISRKKFTEIRYKKTIDKKIYRELVSFSGWSLFGSIAGVGITQVNTILINIFFGPIVTAARAISLQFSYAFNSFIASFIIAIRPRMIRSYAEESYEYLDKLFNLSNKFIYYGLIMICIPLIIEMKTVLILWVKISTVQTELFSRLMLVYALIMALNNPISIIIHATGHVKQYHLYVEFFTLLVAPITFYFYSKGYPAHITYHIMIVGAIFAHVARLICLKRYYMRFNIKRYLESFILPAIIVTVITTVTIYIISMSITGLWLRLITCLLLSILLVSLQAYFIGLNKAERLFIGTLYKRFLLKTKISL